MRRSAVMSAAAVWLAAIVAGAVVAPIAGQAPIGPAGAVAQATPRALQLPAVPDPSECTGPQRTLDSVRAVLGDPPPAPTGDSPPSGIADPLPPDLRPADPPTAPEPLDPLDPLDPSSGDPASDAVPLDPELGGAPPVQIGVALPTGEPADPATIAAVTATVRHFVACANARDIGRIYALVSDAFLRQSFGNQPTTEAVAAYLAATPTARADADRTELVAIRDVLRLADGRIGALVDDRDPTDPRTIGVSTDWIVFVDADGRLLIDEVVSGIEAFYGPNVTPAP